MEGQITKKELERHIEIVLLANQDKAMLNGMLVSELKLALWRKYGFEIHANRIHSTLRFMRRVKRRPLDVGNRKLLYIYSITTIFPSSFS